MSAVLKRSVLWSAVMMAGAISAATAQGAAPAAPPAPVRTVLQTTDVAASPAQETLMATVVIAPGSGNAPHTHFGTEMGYVVAGHIRIEMQGQPSRDLGPGDSFLVPRGVVHRSVLIGNETATLVNSWAVDKGKPLLTPAPAAK